MYLMRAMVKFRTGLCRSSNDDEAWYDDDGIIGLPSPGGGPVRYETNRIPDLHR